MRQACFIIFFKCDPGHRHNKEKRLTYGKHKKIWELEKKSYRRLIIKNKSLIINYINVEWQN